MTHSRILIFANAFDKTHDLMGFLPSWVHALQSQGATITVIAQEVGEAERGASVVNLDKQLHPSAVSRLWRAWRMLWRLRGTYDAVFVVMAPSWAVVLVPLTWLTGKRLYLWYAVWRGSWKLRVASWVVTGIFCSVPASFPFQGRKVHAVGQAIDTERFSPDAARRVSGQILCLGRISPVKRIDLLLEALAELELPDARSVIIAGGPISDDDRAYENMLRATVDRLGLGEAIVWLGRIGHDSVHELYQRADVAVNMTPAGSFDKAMLEAMASGAIVVASNPAVLAFMPRDIAAQVGFRQDDASDLARALQRVAAMRDAEKGTLRTALREAVIQHHSISRWARNILTIIG